MPSPKRRREPAKSDPTDDEAHPIALAIRLERVAQGLTQGELAAALGTSQSRVSNHEAGHTDLSESNLARAAEAMKTTPVRMLERAIAHLRKKAPMPG